LAALAIHPAFADGPAVLDVNGKLSAGFGGIGANNIYYGAGSIDAPLGSSWGFQADGIAGGFGGNSLYGGAAHLFWRDPAHALVGLYASDTHFDISGGGGNVEHIGGEAEWYLDRVTVRGIAGWEGGDVRGGFFDRADIVWYADDNFSLSIGQRYSGTRDAGVFRAEYEFADSNFALFGEVRGGGDHTYGFLVGVTAFLGSGGQSLITRARTEDPDSDLPDGIGDAAGLHHNGCFRPGAVIADTCSSVIADGAPKCCK
jgi:hypothetical protein